MAPLSCSHAESTQTGEARMHSCVAGTEIQRRRPHGPALPENPLRAPPLSPATTRQGRGWARKVQMRAGNCLVDTCPGDAKAVQRSAENCQMTTLFSAAGVAGKRARYVRRGVWRAVTGGFLIYGRATGGGARRAALPPAHCDAHITNNPGHHSAIPSAVDRCSASGRRGLRTHRIPAS